MQYSSLNSAINSVRRLFSNHPLEDEISIPEALVAWDRSPGDREKNMSWLYNKLVPLKKYNLIKSIYGIKDSKRVLEKLQLTTDGKREIGRIHTDNRDEHPTTHKTVITDPKISLEAIMKEIPRLREENPEFEITFDVKLKNI